ncbi:4-(cytidine 5'-diphospho)-2-C-methyl-D-erythritol kinase [Collimonas sp.]|jgi:4-diphosphocytidyl-2-C-methyl-D-erythritol kinase|uniref:4-(cytidine 5'-diphospho)-2-C-methyl-D-erythritol kinase n=1 Tax=Collimonas sp. TaxID=1963772 RepID=UPI002C37F93D|nr:4-(cytidine 5'-diphospho)-2-C-methyl-D-erythritol kinase [Collimonas sp.]HWW07446.1 4-(cytidine 5'-diphospho)-2-C-methyl-D-erythritol kinase [Collimonas sp.]
MTLTLNNCPAPAKLNLFLHVTGRRPDGYHLLQTVFQLVDFSDLLHFEVRADDLIRRTTDIPGVPEESDLIVRAARLLQNAIREKAGAAGITAAGFGANISIEKKLPMGGGLGGGSSDAATTLMALNHLWQGGLSREELMVLGLQLGADVPFFLFGRNAFAEGIGETLQKLDTPSQWFVIIQPGVTIPTALIFSSSELTRNTKPVKMTDFSIGTKKLFGKNDLEPVAAKQFPEVADAIKWLSNYGEARMTGSGACVFCGFTQEEQADEVLKQLPNHWKAWKAKAMQEHPLAGLLDR